VAVVDRLGFENELLVHQLQQCRKRRDRGRDEPALDARDRRLARPRAGGALRRRQAVSAPCLAQKRRCLDGAGISFLM
jgi:hypothetical protein